MFRTTTVRTTLATLAVLGLATAPLPAQELLNVSYDPTRELYADVNAAYIKYWKEKTGQALTIQQSHGGSGKQARAVIDGEGFRGSPQLPPRASGPVPPEGPAPCNSSSEAVQACSRIRVVLRAEDMPTSRPGQAPIVTSL